MPALPPDLVEQILELKAEFKVSRTITTLALLIWFHASRRQMSTFPGASRRQPVRRVRHNFPPVIRALERKASPYSSLMGLYLQTASSAGCCGPCQAIDFSTEALIARVLSLILHSSRITNRIPNGKRIGLATADLLAANCNDRSRWLAHTKLRSSGSDRIALPAG